MVRCQFMMKPLWMIEPRQCPALVLPGEDYCPLHFIMKKRMEERKEKFERPFKYSESKGRTKE